MAVVGVSDHRNRLADHLDGRPAVQRLVDQDGGVLLGILFLAVAINEFLVYAVVDTWRVAHMILGIFFLLGSLWAFLQPKEAFWALASILGFLLVLQGTMTLLAAVAGKGPLWGLGLAVGILEILLGFWASQQYYPARATLILIWVGFMALFRGIGEIVLAFHVRHEEG